MFRVLGIYNFALVIKLYNQIAILSIDYFLSVGEEEELWKLSPFWVEDQRPHINPHRYGILMNNPRLCQKDEKIDLLIMVASAVDHQGEIHNLRLQFEVGGWLMKCKRI